MVNYGKAMGAVPRQKEVRIPTMKKVLLIINPASGTRQWRRFLPDWLALLGEADFLPAVMLTRARGDACEWARKWASDYDLLIVCGGDGTLNEAVTGLLAGDHRTPVGYLPAGSTNDFAAGLGLSTNLMQACRDLLRGVPRVLDVGRFGPNRYFTYTASFGLFSSVSYSTPQNAKNLLGHVAYILEGIRSLADIRPIHLKIRTDDREVEDDYIFGAICNSTSLGGVLKLDENVVHMSDGLFETLLIPFPVDLLALNRILAALRGKNYGDPSLVFLRSRRFEIVADGEISWSLDGEEAVSARVQEIVNLHEAVRILCPPSPAGM